MKRLSAVIAIAAILIACNNESKTEITVDPAAAKTADSLKKEMNNLSDSVKRANQLKADSARRAADSIAARK